MKIKGMDKNMQCRGFQFEIGKEYKIEHEGRPLELCSDTVFHYCDSLKDVHNFYSVKNPENRFFEIKVLGSEITNGNKCGSDHISIVREITGEELDSLKGLTAGNSGLFNTGNRNSGDRNSGDYNSGHYNSGDWNSGHYNSGDWNSGYCNSGYCNSGDRNSGHYNSGHYNSGNRNSGMANSCDYSNGVFCTESDKNIRIFNKPSGMSLAEFCNSIYWAAMQSVPFILTEWINYTQNEKEADEQKRLIGGYLKEYTMKEAWANWWDKLTDENKEIIKQIPNFDPEIFKEITGIEVEEGE